VREPTSGQLIASLLTGAWRQNSPAPDLSAKELLQINTMLQKSGAGGLAWWRIRESGLRETTTGQELQQAYRLQTLQMARRELDIKQVFQGLRSEGIEPILLKGWAIARLYPEKGLRIFGDIDLFVRPEDRRKTMRLLQETELHRYPIDLEHLDFQDMRDRTPAALYAASQLVSMGDTAVRVLGAEDHLRFMALHVLHHIAWRPIWFCDLAVAIENRPPEFDWQLCFGANKRVVNWIETAIALTGNLLGANLQDTPLANRAARLPAWLAPNVLAQWERWCAVRDVPPPKLMAESLRQPSGLPQALKARWHDPLTATIKCRMKFNSVPRLPIQIAAFLAHVAEFSKRLPVWLLHKDSLRGKG